MLLKEICVLAQPKPECPEGVILDEHHPNNEVDAFFEGYANPLGMSHNHPSLLYVQQEDGESIIRHTLGYEGLYPHRYGVDRFLVGGEEQLRDYSVSAAIALDHFSSTDNADSSRTVSAMAGVFARFRNNRNYYFCGIEGVGSKGRAVLYCRTEDTYQVLGEMPLYVHIGHYYNLELQVHGADLAAWVDGVCFVKCQDDTFHTGKAGFRFTSAGRAKRFEVWMQRDHWQFYQNRLVQWQRECRQASEQYPPMALLSQVDLKRYAPFQYSLVDLPDGETGYLICGSSCTALIARDGRVIWETPIVGSFEHITKPVGGTFDIAGIRKKEGMVAVLDGADGHLRRQIACPTDQVESLIPRYRYAGWVPVAANTRGLPVARDIVVRSSASPAATGSELYVYDENLELIWKKDKIFPPYGHQSSLAFYDMDGSGRDSIFAGCTRLSPDGEILWRAQCADVIENTVDGMHVDSCIVADYTDIGRPLLYCAASSAGFYVIDTLDGSTISHTVMGHAQQVFSGAYYAHAHALSVFTRWGNFGIVRTFNPWGEPIASFQPDHVSEGGLSVNWMGDGHELICLCSGTKETGLYDGYGRRVVIFPDEIMEKQPRRNGRNFLRIHVRPIGEDPRDHIFFNLDGVICEYGPREDWNAQKHWYRPVRRQYASDPQCKKEVAQ